MQNIQEAAAAFLACKRVAVTDDYGWSSDIGGLAILDGTSLLDYDGRVRIEAIREHLEPRLHLVPRFRQLLYRPRLGLGAFLRLHHAVADGAAALAAFGVLLDRASDTPTLIEPPSTTSHDRRLPWPRD